MVLSLPLNAGAESSENEIRYDYSYETAPEEVKETFEQLSELKQYQFLKKRQRILHFVDLALQKTKFVAGLGIVTGQGVSFVAKKVKSSYEILKTKIKPHSVSLAEIPTSEIEFSELSRELQSYERESQMVQEKEFSELQKFMATDPTADDPPKSKMSLKQKIQVMRFNSLRALDKVLWHHSEIVADSNEYGLVLEGGIVGLGGDKKFGWGGMLDFGLSISYVADQNLLVFEIYKDQEKFIHTHFPKVYVAGLVGKFGLNISRYSTKSERILTGSTFYPPGVPGFLSSSETMINFGASSGLTIPPPPLGDLLTYTNAFTRTSLFYLKIKPSLKSFSIKIGTDASLKTFTDVRDMAKDVMLDLRYQNSCKRVHSRMVRY